MRRLRRHDGLRIAVAVLDLGKGNFTPRVPCRQRVDDRATGIASSSSLATLSKAWPAASSRYGRCCDRSSRSQTFGL